MGFCALVSRVRGVVALAVLWGTFVAPAFPVGHGLVWGGRAFSNPLVFRDWLSARGQTYARWAAHHPTGLAIIERTPIPAPSGPVSGIRPVPSPDRGWPPWVSPALIALAAVLCLGTAFPVRVLEEHGLMFLVPVRFGLFVAGIAVLAVVFVAATLN